MANRIVTKQIFKELWEKAEPQEVTKYVDIHKLTGKRNLLTTINGLNKDEMVESIFQLFLQASEELRTTVDKIRFTGTRNHSGFEAVRLERPAEMLERVEREAWYKADKLREQAKRKNAAARAKEAKIKQLEKELKELKYWK